MRIASNKGARVLGLDLSLRAAAGFVVPGSWTPGDWKSVKTKVFGYSLEKASKDHGVVRIVTLANVLADFAEEEKVTHVFVEDYAYGLASHGGMALGELGGAIKFHFFQKLGLIVRPVNMNSARKYFLGKLPPRDRAVATHNMIKQIGCPLKTSDERDAFVVGNYGMTELGFAGLSLG